MRLRPHHSVPLWGAAAFVACAPVSETPPPPAAAAIATREEVPAAPPGAARVMERPAFSEITISGIRFSGVSFDARSHRLVVIDQAGGPGSEFADASAAARSSGALAVANAGFFTPEGAPLGLVMSGGKQAGAWNSASSLGSGIWHDGAISRRGTLDRAQAMQATELIQAGPMLVERGNAVSGLDTGKSSARTILWWDGGSRWWIGRSAPCSLDAAARALAGGGPAGWPVVMALNLDGGRSSELWISAKVAGGPVHQRPVWNRPVRNFLALVPR